MKGIMKTLMICAIAFSLALSACGNGERAADAEPDYDVVIVGAGGGGLAAALEAANAGATVLVLEKMPMVGGNTLYATGGMNAPATPQQADLGIEDSVDLFIQDTLTGGQELNDEELVRVMAGNAADAVAWLVELGADMSDVGRLGGSSVNRTHRPTGGAPVGNEIVQTLENAANEHDSIEIRTWNEVTGVRMDDNRAVGVTATDRDGEEYTVSAGAVIIATGGFGANDSLFAEIDPDLEGFGTTNHPGATGEHIEFLRDRDVAFVDLEQIQTHPTVVPEVGALITEAVRGNGAITVNRDGERFVDEMGTRDVVSEAFLAQEGGTGFLVFDNDIRESLAALEGYIRRGFVMEADSLEELAEEFGAPSQALADTVDRYNELVDAGSDSDYNRSSLPRDIRTPPFYAIEVGPAVHHTMGGVSITPEAEVRDTNGDVVPGLYAAGEATGGVHGANRLGGNALADIIVFGRIAGENAAASAQN
ncbi:MAG: flavocytochrome c [Spirochaetota bacterium]